MSDVVLTSADIDHIGGLLSLREGHRFDIHATSEVVGVLAGNAVFDVLAQDRVRRQRFATGEKHPLACGLSVEPFAVPGKLPLYLEGENADTSLKSGTTVGARISSAHGSFYYVPGCSELDADVRARLAGAELVFFDGTLWTDDELIASRTGSKTGRRMGHMPVGGDNGSLAVLKSIGVRRLVYTHINNTNPMLIEGSPEGTAVAAAGAEIGFDGMEVTL